MDTHTHHVSQATQAYFIFNDIKSRYLHVDVTLDYNDTPGEITVHVTGDNDPDLVDKLSWAQSGTIDPHALAAGETSHSDNPHTPHPSTIKDLITLADEHNAQLIHLPAVVNIIH